jgi:hypothetical protein
MDIPPFILIKACLLIFLAIWLCLAATGNFLDAGTNRHLLGEMMRMSQLKDDPLLGKGLMRRAWMWPSAPKLVLVLVSVYEFGVATLLLRAGWYWLATPTEPGLALAASDQALLGFGALWCFFLLGGLWFGYWIKTPLLQQVHMTLLLLTLLCVLLMHAQS